MKLLLSLVLAGFTIAVSAQKDFQGKAERAKETRIKRELRQVQD